MPKPERAGAVRAAATPTETQSDQVSTDPTVPEVAAPPEPAAATPPEAPRPTVYVVAPGSALTSKERGIIDQGQVVAPEDFMGGDETFADLKAKGLVVLRTEPKAAAPAPEAPDAA